MSAEVPTTRMGLLRARRRLEKLGRGLGLLEKKREALANELFARARDAVEARGSIVEQAGAAYPALVEALAERGAEHLVAIAEPLRPLSVTLREVEARGVTGAEIAERPPLSRTLEGRGATPLAAGESAIEAARRFEALVDALLEAAGREELLRRLGQALAEASRQLNALEHRVQPELTHAIATVRRRLEEREREEHLRLRHLRRTRR